MGATKTIVEVDNFCYGQDVDTIVDSVLKSRGIKDVDEFLDPGEEYISPPDDIPNLYTACSIVAEAANNGKRIFLNVDSDADGVTSGAIIKRYIEHCWSEQTIDWWISQGKSHGTSRELTALLEENVPDVLIIVDSLDNNVFNYKKYKDLGIQVVVLDHHLIKKQIAYDQYVTLASSQNSSNHELSGAGVCWKFCKAMDDLTDNDYADELVDLAATGLIADMMNVSSECMENRAIINLGLNHLVNPALKKIIGGFRFDAQAVAFSIAPLINACCRYGENDSAFEAFISDDQHEIARKIKVMKHCKDCQRTEVDECCLDLEEQFKSQMDKPVLCGMVRTTNGIHGLIANKTLSKYQRPVLILNNRTKNGQFKGSGRSNLDGNFSQDCEDTGVSWVGGHENAFGIYIDEDKLDLFLNRIRDKYSNLTFSKSIHVDVAVEPEDLSTALIDAMKDINRIAGKGFPSVQVGVTLTDWWVETMSQGRHLVFKDGFFTYIQWNAGDQLEYYEKLADQEKPLMVVGSLDSGFFGRRFVPRLIINQIVED